MKTTTEVITRLTITTDDDGARAISRTTTADTLTEYLFSELSKEAQNRAISDAIEEEQRTAYEWGSQTYFTTQEILDCAADLQKQQPVEVSQDYGCSWYGTARGTNYYGHHPARWEDVTEATDNGVCFSMDICDKWNEYAARIIVMQEGYEEATEQAEEHEYRRDIAECEQMETKAYTTNYALWERLEAIKDKELDLTIMYERIAERIENAAEELTEEAAQAVGNTVDGLIEAEAEYYSSREFWEEWLDDGETRFTRDGARI